MKRVFLLFVFLLSGIASAAELTIEQVKTAAGNWALRNARPFGIAFGTTVSDLKTYRDGDGGALFHIAKFSGGGFAVMSADTGVRPVIAFSSGAEFDADERNPLWVLLNGDLPARMNAVRSRAPSPMQLFAAGDSTEIPAEDEWSNLLALRQTRAISGVDDLRVAPLIQSRWDQTTVNSKNVYNYYTPNNYYCGCLATAMAQVMRYYQYPTASVAADTYSCSVNDAARQLTMKGGVYGWANMPLIPNSQITDVQREAIGKLTYDAGVSVKMNYTSGGSDAYPSDATIALTNRFNYENSINIMRPGNNIMSFITNAVLANLDARAPVIFGISGAAGGHAVVGDGYGYQNSVLYVHLNMGWSGTSDIWYNLPTIDAYYNFDEINAIIFNIFPTNTGEIISGRVLLNGTPAADITVIVSNAATKISTVTDSNGIYAAIVPPSQTYQITASKNYGMWTSVVQNVSVGISTSTQTSGSSYYPSTGAVGNRRAADISLLYNPLNLGEVLDNTNLNWSTGGGTAVWYGQSTGGENNGDSAQSGALGNGQNSWIETTVAGPGILNFKWSAPANGQLSVTVDGAEKFRTNNTGSWTQTHLHLTNGTHAVRWTYYQNAGIPGVARLDQIVWTQRELASTNTPAPVPFSWFEEAGLVAAGSAPEDYENAAAADADGDGLTAWQEFVAGTNPTNPASQFTAYLTNINGTVEVRWTPDLGTKRRYSIQGKPTLFDPWGATNSASRFFRVNVQMP